ncbi:MAG: phosphoribosylaminoimidazolesuccinocarboxamide synthase [Polyangiaceae bacterium]|nr:phosphoribosylaminoimidazolesuccinocarboxamide synthase [Polyangiaceae bacterium]
MVGAETLQAALPNTLSETDPQSLGVPPGWRRYEGKVRDNYTAEDGRRLLVTTDRISAFDRVLGTLPFKGQVLNRIAAHWFSLTKSFAPNHLIRVVDPQAVLGRECRSLPVEMVVRSYLTGVTSTSIWTAYERGERVFCGHRLPNGLKKNEPLPAPILTPSTKAPKGGHDISVSRGEILQAGGITEAEFDRAAEIAMTLFTFGQAECEKRGLILVDTKYEMGALPNGEIVVIDEIHTPDSSRFWFKGSYPERLAREEEPESFDKEYVRRWLAGIGFKGDGPIPAIPDDVRVEAARRYIAAYETIVGEPFVPDEEAPLPRLRRNLAAVFA